MSNATLKLEFALDSKDFWAFNHVTCSGRKPQSAALLVLGLVTWIAIAYMAIHLYRTGNALNFSAPQWIYGPGIILALFSLAVYLPGRHNRKVFEPQPDRFILGRKTYEFSPQMIQITGAHSFSQYQWSAIFDFVDDKEHFFLFMDSSVAFIIPKRVFASEDEQEAFKELVAESHRKAHRRFE